MPTAAPRPRSRRRVVAPILLVITALACLAGAVASRTPAGQAALNVTDYKLRSAWWSLVGKPQFDPARTGSIVGVIQDVDGRPIAEAIALVATVEGHAFPARSDSRGRYRIDGVPPGRYVPMAAAWGFDEQNGPPVQVRAGAQVSGVDFTLATHVVRPVAPTNLQLGQRWQATTQFPEPMVATRIPFTFTLDGLSINNGQIYLPAHAQGTQLTPASQPTGAAASDAATLSPAPQVSSSSPSSSSPSASPAAPTLVIIYPSHPLNWNAASVALTRDGNPVLALGPDGDRALDIEGHVRDLRAALQLWQGGELTPLAFEPGNWVLMSGSFGSLIMFRALRDLPAMPPAIVNVGGVSDAFLGIQALYADREALKIPPPYDSAIAAMGRPDRDPAFFFGFSPVFYAAHLPPMFVIHTYNDEVIPYTQGEAMAAALAAAGVPHELLLYEDTTHYLDAYNPTPGTELVYERVLKYVQDVSAATR